MNVFIIEDDVIWRTKIEMFAAELGIAVMGKADNVNDSRKFLDTHTPDLIVSDIILDEENAFALFEDGRFLDIPVLFLTQSNNPENYSKAKHVRHSHFLMKPFQTLTLQAAIDILMKSVAGKTERQLKAITVRGRYKEKIDIPLQEIIYVRQQRNKCFIKTAHHEFSLKISLSNIEKKLNDDFIQVNRSYIVNKYFITQLTLDKKIFRLAKQQVVIGRAFRNNVMQYLSTRGML